MANSGRTPFDTGAAEQRLQALYAAADPNGEPSEALVRRISELAARHAAASEATRARRPLPGRLVALLPGRALPRIARWCVVGLLVALMAGIRPAGRPDGSAVAAALRASASAPALHVVGRGAHETQELWYVAGAGVYLYGKRPQYETILVDDLERHYRYEIRERRVYLGRSLLGTPRGDAHFWETHSGSGLLKQMLAAWGPKGVSVETVTRNGRTLRQLVGPRRITRITIDPETDRILMVDVDNPQPDGTNDWMRYEFFYPDPATVDRSHFKFRVPPGVTVVDQTARP
jgi:hypothetical protein